jgi:CheY-like chemotaxis protein
MRLRILVVDDDAAVRKAVARLLGTRFDVDVVPSAEDALAILRLGTPFDAILCDLVMPDVTGMQLHAILRAEFPELAARTVFMTGSVHDPAVAAFLRTTTVTCLTKPFRSTDAFDALTAIATGAR